MLDSMASSASGVFIWTVISLVDIMRHDVKLWSYLESSGQFGDYRLQVHKCINKFLSLQWLSCLIGTIGLSLWPWKTKTYPSLLFPRRFTAMFSGNKLENFLLLEVWTSKGGHSREDQEKSLKVTEILDNWNISMGIRYSVSDAN